MSQPPTPPDPGQEHGSEHGPGQGSGPGAAGQQPPRPPSPPPGYGTGGRPGYPYAGYGQPGYGQPGYGQPAYGQAGYGGWPPAPTPNGKATAALVTGISTLVLSWCCGLGVVGVVAVVLGVQSRREVRASGGAQTGDGLALAGIITGSVAIAVGLLSLVLVVVAVLTGGAQFDTNFQGTGV